MLFTVFRIIFYVVCDLLYAWCKITMVCHVCNIVYVYNVYRPGVD